MCGCSKDSRSVKLLRKCEQLCDLRNFLEEKGVAAKQISVTLPLAVKLMKVILREIDANSSLEFTFERVGRYELELNNAGILSGCSLRQLYDTACRNSVDALAILAQAILFLLERFLAGNKSLKAILSFETMIDEAYYRSFTIHIRNDAKMTEDCGSDIAEPPKSYVYC